MFFNLPNSISFLRCIISLLIILEANIILHNKKFYIILIALAAFTDYTDGYIARKKNIASKIGTIVDYTCDKIFFSSVLLVFTIYLFIPLWLMYLHIVREFIILSIRINLRDKIEPRIAIIIGKFKTGVFYFVLLVYPFDIDILFTLLLITILLSFLSIIAYFLKIRAT